MSTRDDDILDFDFFDEEDAPSWEEPEGLETPPPTSERRGGRGRGSRFGPPRNLTPLLRLVGLIALAILVIVLLAVWVEGCTADAKRDRNSTYLAEIGAIGNASARLGQQLSTLLTTPGLNAEDLDAKLGGYIQTAENQMQNAADLNAPGPDGRPELGCRRVAPLSRERAQGPPVCVQGDRGRDGRERRRRAAPRPDASATRERHHLDRLVPGAGDGRPPGRGHRGPRRPVVRVRHRRRPRQSELSRGDLAAHPGRVDRRHADRPPRQPDRVPEGTAERAAPLDDDRDDDQGHRRARLRGRGHGLGREPGGPA